jgi:hypothetical protein
MSMDEEHADEDKAFEERLREAEEFIRRKWPTLNDAQIADMVDRLRRMRGREGDD